MKPLTVAWRSSLLPAKCFTSTTSFGWHHLASVRLMTGAISASGRRSPLELKPAAMVDANRLMFRSLDRKGAPTEADAPIACWNWYRWMALQAEPTGHQPPGPDPVGGFAYSDKPPQLGNVITGQFLARRCHYRKKPGRWTAPGLLPLVQVRRHDDGREAITTA